MRILNLTNREVAKIDTEHENWMINFLLAVMKRLRSSYVYN